MKPGIRTHDVSPAASVRAPLAAGRVTAEAGRAQRSRRAPSRAAYAGDLRVRPATAADAEGFACVVAAVAAEERWIATEPPVDVAEFAARVRGMIADGLVAFVLVNDGGGVVGTLGLHPTHASGVVSLGMSIVSEARGRGGGRMLLEAALEWLAASDNHKVELEVWPDNTRAIALYERFGFEHEGVRHDHYRRRDGVAALRGPDGATGPGRRVMNGSSLLRACLAPARVGAVIGALLLVTAAPTEARVARCPHHAGTLATTERYPNGVSARVWHQGTSLYGCTTAFRRTIRRLGPYRPGTTVAVTPWGHVAWTVPLLRDGVRSDRIWATTIDERQTWLAGKRLVPRRGSESEREGQILRVVVTDGPDAGGAAWVTRAGDVAMATQVTNESPVPIGALPVALKPAGRRLLVGSFGESAAAHIASTLKIAVDDEYGDGCEGGRTYATRFSTAADGDEIGAAWRHFWLSDDCL